MSSDEDDCKDPASKHPWKRYIIRSFITEIFILLALAIPFFIFYIISIIVGLPTEIGILVAFISFIIYIYIFFKKELWSKVKR